MADVAAVTSKTEVMAENNRLRNRLAKAKEQTEEATRKGVLIAAGTAGGFLSGYLSVKMPVVPGTMFPTDAAGAIVAGALALFDAGGKFNDALLAGSIGMAAAAAKEPGKRAAQ
jgi:hypothetical protein